MSDYQKLHKTITQLLKERSYKEIHNILYLDKYFYWGEEFIKVSRNRRNDILKDFKNLELLIGKYIKHPSIIKRKWMYKSTYYKHNNEITYKHIASNISRYCNDYNFEGLYKYLTKHYLLKKRKNPHEDLRYRVEVLLENQPLLIFIFGSVKQFRDFKGKYRGLAFVQKIFLSHNVVHSQKYLMKIDFNSYLKMSKNQKNKYGELKILNKKSLFSNLWRKLFFPQSHYDNYYFLRFGESIFYYNKIEFDKTIDAYGEGVRRYVDGRTIL